MLGQKRYYLGEKIWEAVYRLWEEGEHDALLYLYDLSKGEGRKRDDVLKEVPPTVISLLEERKILPTTGQISPFVQAVLSEIFKESGVGGVAFITIKYPFEESPELDLSHILPQ